MVPHRSCKIKNNIQTRNETIALPSGYVKNAATTKIMLTQKNIVSGEKLKNTYHSNGSDDFPFLYPNGSHITGIPKKQRIIFIKT